MPAQDSDTGSWKCVSPPHEVMESMDSVPSVPGGSRGDFFENVDSGPSVPGIPSDDNPYRQKEDHSKGKVDGHVRLSMEVPQRPSAARISVPAATGSRNSLLAPGQNRSSLTVPRATTGSRQSNLSGRSSRNSMFDHLWELGSRKPSQVSSAISESKFSLALKRTLTRSVTQQALENDRIVEVVEGIPFALFLSFLILADFAIHLVVVQQKASNEDVSWLLGPSWALLCIFFLEACVRIYLRANNLSMLTKRKKLDMFIVVLSLTGAIATGVSSSIAIIPRVLRVFSIVWFIGPRVACLKWLFMIANTVVQSFEILFCGLALFLMTLLVFSVFFMELFRSAIQESMNQSAVDRFGEQTVENCRRAFSSLLSSMSTLFALSIGDQWHDIAFPIISVRPWVFIVFVMFILLSSVVLVGIVFAALSEALKTCKAEHLAAQQQDRMREKKLAMERLSEVFQSMDTDGNDELTWQEFYHNRIHNPEFARLMSMFDIDVDQLDLVWDILDSAGKGKVNEQEFLDVMWRLQSGETKWTLIQTGHCTMQVFNKIMDQQKQIQQISNSIDGQKESIQTILKAVKGGKATKKEKKGSGSDSESSSGASKSGSSKSSDDEEDDEPEECDVKTVSARSVKSLEDGDDEPVDHRASSASRKAEGTENSRMIRRMDTNVRPQKGSGGGLFADLTVEHMRSVTADIVASYRKESVVDFWTASDRIDEKQFNLSTPCDRCDFFVSHCWTSPPDWGDHFKRTKLDVYEYKKAMELSNVLEGLCKNPGTVYNKQIKEIRVWVDKCCIPQQNKEVKAMCVALIEGFLKKSDGLIVLLSWTYFTRLWCIYEWACFLRLHHPLSVTIGLDAFLRTSASETLPLYIKSIEEMSVKGAQCWDPDDKVMLSDKVAEYYVGETATDSHASFERFAKTTAIGFIAKQIVQWRARTSEADEIAWLGPLRALADRLGLKDLLKVLNAAQPSKWFDQSRKDQSAFDEAVRYWFHEMVVKLLLLERKRAVRPQYLISFSGRKSEVGGGSGSRRTISTDKNGRRTEVAKTESSINFNPEKKSKGSILVSKGAKATASDNLSQAKKRATFIDDSARGQPVPDIDLDDDNQLASSASVPTKRSLFFKS